MNGEEKRIEHKTVAAANPVRDVCSFTTVRLAKRSHFSYENLHRGIVVFD